jgi:acetyl-CoA carboxylase biotin carboxylase subunit
MKSKPINKILVANRGEIAVRVINACREMGIKTVAIYSDVDERALHVLKSDQAVHIGQPEPANSYLNIEKIVAAAVESGCDAVHPGYGFLSENEHFARACQSAGLIFIGPTPEAIRAVGDKLIARQTMVAAGIPVTPGVEIEGQETEWIAQQAEKIGFPVMVKAAAGGGGKGMRIVHSKDELTDAIAASRREAKSAFGNDTVYMEKFIEKPRHVEFQVLADQHGNIVHLFERECSIQRRHQKIIEETPSPALDPELRTKMGEVACRVMKAVNYTNAGTVEFLLDEQRNFYFLEVNARIQVEHPITEMVTGVDLVKQQIRIAAGEPLPFIQSDLKQIGHAIECRIYAEDPANKFFPSIGKLLYTSIPEGPGIRVDTGVYSGVEVTHFYDPILSKLIVHARNRAEAIEKMRHALQNYIVLGVKTGIPFMLEVLAHPKFIAGDIDTGFIAKHMPEWQPQLDETHQQLAAVVAATQAATPSATQRVTGAAQGEYSPWHTLGQWQLF